MLAGFSGCNGLFDALHFKSGTVNWRKRTWALTKNVRNFPQVLYDTIIFLGDGGFFGPQDVS